MEFVLNERVKTVRLKTMKCGTARKTHDKVDSISSLLKAEAVNSGTNQITANRLSIKFDNRVSKKDSELVVHCMAAKGKKARQQFQNLLTEMLCIEPNNFWAHFLNAATCHRIPEKKGIVIRALACCVALNPNFKTAWSSLFEIYKKQGGLFKKDTFCEMFLITKGALLIEEDFVKWTRYATELSKYLFWTENLKQQTIVFDVFKLFLNDKCTEKINFASKVIFSFTYEKRFLKDRSKEILKACKHLALFYKDGLTFFHMVSKIFLKNDAAAYLCDFIVYIYENGLLKLPFDITHDFPDLVDLLFERVGCYCFEAVSKLLNYKVKQGFLQPFTAHTQPSNYLNYLACGKYNKLSKYLSKQNLNVSDIRRIIYHIVIGRQGYFERLFKTLLHDLFSMEKSEVRMFNWYIRKLIILMCKVNDEIIQKLGVSCAYRYMEKYGYNSELLYAVALANISIFNDAGNGVLKSLLKTGCLELVIYLKTMFEDDYEQRADNLKSIPISLNYYILNINLAINQKKRNKIKQNMIMASMRINYQSMPFEWLGLHYLEEPYNPQRALYYLESAIEINPYSAVAVINLADLIRKELGEQVGKLFLNFIKNTEMASSWALVPICYKAGYLYLYRPQSHADFFMAVELLRTCCFRQFRNKNYKQMVAEAYREYGMHISSLAFFKECVKSKQGIDIFSLTMGATELGHAKKYHRFINVSRLAYFLDTKNILAMYTYVSAIIEKSYSLFCVNDIVYGLFLLQIGILIASRAISLKTDCVIIWKALGDLFYLCGTASENMTQIYAPSWLYRRKGIKKKMSCLNKYECLIASLRCYYIGLKHSDDSLSSEFWYSIGFVCYHLRHLLPEEKFKLLNYTRKSAEMALSTSLTWESLNMLGVVLYNGNLKEESVKCLESAFKFGYKSFSKELEMNLGYLYLSKGDLLKSFTSFLYRRGFDTHDSEIWPCFAMLKAAAGKPTEGLNHLMYHLYNIRSVPSISEWYFFMKIINNTCPNLKNILNYRNIYMSKYENNFYSLIFERSRIPHRVKDLTALNYFMMGMNQSQYAEDDGRYALENFYNCIKILAYDYTPCERYSRLLEDILEEIGEIQNKHRLGRYFRYRKQGDENKAYEEILQGLKCEAKRDDLFAILLSYDMPVPDGLRQDFKTFLLKQIKGALTLREKQAHWFWSNEASAGYSYLGHKEHLHDFLKNAHKQTFANYKKYFMFKNTLYSIPM